MYLAFFTSLCIFHVMESLSTFGVNSELSRQGLLRKLLRYSDEGRLVSLRDDLFALRLGWYRGCSCD